MLKIETENLENNFFILKLFKILCLKLIEIVHYTKTHSK